MIDILPMASEWWKGLNIGERDAMMKKHDEQIDTEKSIRRMYSKEFMI